MNFELSMQNNIVEIEMQFPKDFELSGNLDYPYSDQVGGMYSRLLKLLLHNRAICFFGPPQDGNGLSLDDEKACRNA